MPELPDVEHTRKNLSRWMRGARIEHVATEDARIVRPKKPRAFARELADLTVESIERRGKWLCLSLDDGRRLYIHLGMTGWFVHDRPAAPSPAYERVRFDLTRKGKSERVSYVDPRRWGRMLLTREEPSVWAALGPDPLADGIDIGALAARLARRKKRSIKEALMDQSILAGVGNIVATEALWNAGVDPRAKASAVSTTQLRAIASGLRWTIERHLAYLAAGEAAKTDPFCVYGRAGKPCPRCGHRLARVVLGGRTTTYCPHCQ
jgi:formamidopyrimidine-DNA glycosylase